MDNLGYEGTRLEKSIPATSDVKRPWPLAGFFLLSAILSWSVWLWPLQRQGWLKFVVPGWEVKIPFLLIKLVIGNCLPGVLAVIWVSIEGKDQLRLMISSLTKWKTSLKWYFLAVAMPCGVSLIAFDAVLFYSPTDHTFPPASHFLRSVLIILPFGPLWEELAWRAFALRKLEGHYSRLVSALLLGVYWAVWHIPLWLVQLDRLPINKRLYVLAAFVTLVSWSVIWAYLYHRSSESLPVVILLHATYSAATTQTALTAPHLDMQIIYASTILSVFLAAAFSNSLRRMGKNQPSPD
jgi:uncharacterized protein